MLQALGVLGGVFEGWQQGKEAQRRRRLQDLQAESYELKNEGYRLGNKYDRTTMDDRVGTVAAQRGSAEWKEAFDRTRAETAELLQPYTVEIEAQTAALKGNQAATEAQRGRYWDAEADVAQGTVGSRIYESEADAREAGSAAETARIGAQTAAREQIEGIQTDMAELIEANDGDFNAVFNDPVFSARAVGLAQQTVDPSIQNIELQNGNVVIFGEDANEAMATMTPEQFMGAAFNTEDLEKGLSQRAQQRRLEREEAAANDSAASDTQAVLDDTAKRIESHRTQGEESADVGRSLSQLQQRDQSLAAQEEVLRDEVRSGNRGDKAAQAERHAALSALKNERESIAAAMGTLEDEYEEELSHTPDRWDSLAQGLENQIPDIQQEFVNTLGNNRNLTLEARELAQAENISVTEARDRLSGQRSPGSMTVDEQQQSVVTGAQNAQTLREIATGQIDDTFTRLKGHEDISPDRLDSAYQATSQAVQESSNDADNNLFAALHSSDPRQQHSAGVLLDLAMTAHAEGATNAGAFIRGTLKNWSVAGIEAASDMLEDESLAGLPSDMRVQAATGVVDYIERGMSPVEAKRRVLNEVNSMRE